MKAPIEPPPDGSLLIFAGSADISTRNIHTRLEHWLPKNLEIDPPVIQADIPGEYAGLRKVHDWLKSQFPGDGEYEEIDDLTEFISTLETTQDVYLVVLWGKGGDEATEKLVDLAMRHDIQVLDLTEGLDELVLGERTTAPEAPARRTRRARAAAAEEDGPAAAPEQAAGDDRPPWRTDDEEKPAEDLAGQVTRTVAKMLGTVFTSIGSAFLQQSAEGKAPEAPAAAPAGRPGPQAAEPAARRPAGTRAWLQDPADPAKYTLRGRGQPRGEYRTWNVHFLTPEQEADRGLEG